MQALCPRHCEHDVNQAGGGRETPGRGPRGPQVWCLFTFVPSMKRTTCGRVHRGSTIFCED